MLPEAECSCFSSPLESCWKLTGASPSTFLFASFLVLLFSRLHFSSPLSALFNCSFAFLTSVTSSCSVSSVLVRGLCFLSAEGSRGRGRWGRSCWGWLHEGFGVSEQSTWKQEKAGAEAGHGAPPVLTREMERRGWESWGPVRELEQCSWCAWASRGFLASRTHPPVPIQPCSLPSISRNQPWLNVPLDTTLLLVFILFTLVKS